MAFILIFYYFLIIVEVCPPPQQSIFGVTLCGLFVVIFAFLFKTIDLTDLLLSSFLLNCFYFFGNFYTVFYLDFDREFYCFSSRTFFYSLLLIFYFISQLQLYKCSFCSFFFFLAYSIAFLGSYLWRFSIFFLS